jgi:hypothetical protein
MKKRTIKSCSQRGMSIFNFLIVMMVAGFFMMFAFKVVPYYAENMYVVEALKAVGDSAKPVGEMNKREIKRIIQRHYMLNNVRSEGPNNIDVDRSRDGLLVNINYEVRVPFLEVLNLDLVMSFENQLDSSDVEACCKPTKPVVKKK